METPPCGESWTDRAGIGRQRTKGPRFKPCPHDGSINFLVQATSGGAWCLAYQLKAGLRSLSPATDRALLRFIIVGPSSGVPTTASPRTEYEERLLSTTSYMAPGAPSFTQLGTQDQHRGFGNEESPGHGSIWTSSADACQGGCSSSRAYFFYTDKTLTP